MSSARETRPADFSFSSNQKWTFSYQVSAATQDPYLLIQYLNKNAVILFDCGVRVWGRVKTILKLDYLLITHAHIDHMIGFDHIIRALLGESKLLRVYGPPGITDRLAAKLAGYDWDRAADQELVLEINELCADHRIRQTHECRHRFERVNGPERLEYDGMAVQGDGFSIRSALLDHGGSPCLGYSFEEHPQLRIDKEKLDELGLQPGPWVGQLLNAARHGTLDHATLDIQGQSVSADSLAGEIIRMKPGRKLSYVTDTVYSDRVLESLIPLVKDSDVLFCESTFLHEDQHLAARYHHLTSTQAASIAKAADVKKLVLFHVSSRYHPQLHRAADEARTIFPWTELATLPRRQRKPPNGNHFSR